MRRLSLALLLVVTAPTVAAAHIQVTSPLPRTSQQKQANCGLTGSTRSANPTVYEPGATITVAWKETVNHPGHYRISFDQDGESFTIPLSFTDTTQTENVLVDSIVDLATANATYTQEITLPDIECENCTLQIIQMMTDKPPYGDGNDIYFQCSDIALRTGGAPGPDAGVGGGEDSGSDPDDPGNDVSEATGGCSTSSGGGDAGILAICLAVLLVVRPRRSVTDQS